jgi:hypothetical protein
MRLVQQRAIELGVPMPIFDVSNAPNGQLRSARHAAARAWLAAKVKTIEVVNAALGGAQEPLSFASGTVPIVVRSPIQLIQCIFIVHLYILTSLRPPTLPALPISFAAI